MHGRIDRFAGREPDPLRGALAGLVAGLVAAAAMSGFQAVAGKLLPESGSDDEPATDKAADRLSRAATGEALPEDRRPAAGEAVHYAFGALLGAGYGVAAEYGDLVTTGGGTLFGVGVALIADDVAVPALGLAPPAAETPAATHVYAVASHLVFGMTLEVGRRLLTR